MVHLNIFYGSKAKIKKMFHTKIDLKFVFRWILYLTAKQQQFGFLFHNQKGERSIRIES